ncbi:hypothetical protein BTA51_22340 [Hahella sp. CCB-MM4]|uniref:substrate-binding periplasmic protein n=1 Tax=Hahella sp. (strain CCB-MM4) TaxID=1926491 RepID=UPI000B9B592B|nr:hypothetical protein [Hahella sp. CCB-MM4]OZG71121.1 hypothetical protein BTA51_22340 [Hahella sp. CCB-MM4]
MSLPRLIAGILLLLSSQTALALTVCYEEGVSYPYSLGRAALKQTQGGIVVDMLRQAAVHHHLILELRAWPWKRCLQSLQNNEVDGAFAIIWSAERDEIAVFPKENYSPETPPLGKYRLWRAQYPFFVNRSGEIHWDGNQISGYRFGFAAPAGYIAQQKLMRSGLHVSGELDLDTAFRMINLNRLDGYVIETAIGLHRLREMGLADQIITLPIPYMSADWYLAFSRGYFKEHRNTAWQIWQTLAEIRQTRGEELMGNYLPGSNILP